MNDANGCVGGARFIDNAGVAGLSQPLEWYYNATTAMLYMYANGTVLPTEVIATQQHTLLQHNGTQAAPLVNVTVTDLTFAHTEVSYLLPYETPSGGGYSVHRGAAVMFEGAENPVVQRYFWWHNNPLHGLPCRAWRAERPRAGSRQGRVVVRQLRHSQTVPYRMTWFLIVLPCVCDPIGINRASSVHGFLLHVCAATVLLG